MASLMRRAPTTAAATQAFTETGSAPMRRSLRLLSFLHRNQGEESTSPRAAGRQRTSPLAGSQKPAQRGKGESNMRERLSVARTAGLKRAATATEDGTITTVRGVKRVKKAVVSVEMKPAVQKSAATTLEIKEDYVAPPFNYTEAIDHISKAHDSRLAHLTSKIKCELFFSIPALTREGLSTTSAYDVDPAFQSLCRAVIYQQISGKAAQAIMNRFINAFLKNLTLADSLGDHSVGKHRTPDVTELWSAANDPKFFPTPRMVCDASYEILRSCGLSERKVMYVKDIASRFVNGELSIDRLTRLSDEDVAKVLLPIKGIGQWTVDMFLIFTLRRPDVLPLADLGIQKGFAALFGGKSSSSSGGKKLAISYEEMSRLAEPFRPYRSLAIWYIWRALE